LNIAVVRKRSSIVEENREYHMSEPEPQVRLEAIVTGRVQGVGFRYSVLQRARDLAVTGFVRNRWDGTVEVIAEGNKTRVERFLSYLKVGPRSASVREVAVNWAPASGKFDSFEVRF
jgi:acylphosphatase